MLQVVQVVWDLEKLVEGPAVSQKVGKKTINIVSNLMQVDSEVLSASANRYKSHKPHLHITM